LSRDGIPEGWTKIIGPEGFPYFWHPVHQLITDTWIPDHKTYDRLFGFFEQIEAFTKRHNYRRDKEVHLVLDVQQDDKDEWWCGYYLVDHANLSVFWYEKTVCGIKELQEIQVGTLSVALMSEREFPTFKERSDQCSRRRGTCGMGVLVRLHEFHSDPAH
jgi:hypothetical protein